MIHAEIKLSELKRSLTKELKTILSENESLAIARIILEHFELPEQKVLLSPEHLVNSKIQTEIKKIVAELKKNRPIQYILGYTWFFDLRLNVNESTLIPRLETEELVYTIIAENTFQSPFVLDIGTGSGCIAISLAKGLKNSIVSAIDIDKNALKIATINAENNKAEVSFIQQNILKNTEAPEQGPFNIIVSNPPYVMESEKKLMLPNVLNNEPDIALFVPDNDALVFYKAIVAYAENKLTSDGEVWLEINEQLGEETAQLFRDASYELVEIRKDIHGKTRFIKAKKSI